MISELLDKLIADINMFLDKKISDNDLEQSTLALIASDDFDDLPEDVQDAIYTLDNKQLNDLKNKDLVTIKDTIATYVNQISR